MALLVPPIMLKSDEFHSGSTSYVILVFYLRSRKQLKLHNHIDQINALFNWRAMHWI